MKKKKSLRPIRANLGIEVMYRKKLIKTIDEMEASVLRWVSAAYRKSPPKLAEDELASNVLRDAIQKLIRRWYGAFDKMSEELAKYFAQKIGQRSDAALRRILKEGGFAVELKLTMAMREVIGAAVHENVALIKSIPQQCLTQVEGLVMRSVETGRDLGSLTKALRQQFGVTRRRAAFIARDQNNKVTASLARARQIENGITEAIWVHSSAGAEPRPTHVKAGRERTHFDLRMGWYDPEVKRHILPGELPNCLPGSETIDLAYGTRKAYRHWFSGELTEIITGSGKTLRVTPNHPMLTLRGWFPAKSLQMGDYVIEISDHIFGTPFSSVRLSSEKNIDQAIPSISDVFNSIPDSNGSIIAKGGYFHGDIVNSNVDIKLTAGLLGFGRKSLLDQSIDHLSFSEADFLAASIRLSSKFLGGSFTTAAGDVSSESEFLSAPLTFSLHSEPIGFTSVPNYAASEKDSINYGLPGDLMLSSKGQHAKPQLMLSAKATRISGVNRSSFDGHVYNLETETGWFIAQGLIVRNCRCFWKPVVKGFS